MDSTNLVNIRQNRVAISDFMGKEAQIRYLHGALALLVLFTIIWKFCTWLVKKITKKVRTYKAGKKLKKEEQLEEQLIKVTKNTTHIQRYQFPLVHSN